MCFVLDQHLVVLGVFELGEHTVSAVARVLDLELCKQRPLALARNGRVELVAGRELVQKVTVVSKLAALGVEVVVAQQRALFAVVLLRARGALPLLGPLVGSYLSLPWLARLAPVDVSRAVRPGRRDGLRE